MTLLGYARVSTTEQSLAPQTDALRAAGCETIFEDRVLAAVRKRVNLAKKAREAMTRARFTRPSLV